MDENAGMLARLFERSMGLGDEWEVSDVWFEPRGGDASAVVEVTRDMSEARSLGVADAMPDAAQTVDRFHVMQMFSRATDRVRCREARSRE